VTTSVTKGDGKMYYANKYETKGRDTDGNYMDIEKGKVIK